MFIDQYNASKDILTKLFESDEKNIVINYLKFPKGYEKAIEAALGHGLKASLEKASIEWRKVDQLALKSLPNGIESLSNHTKGVPEVLNILKLTGLVENTEQGDLLHHKLLPGQQLVTKNGGQHSMLATARTDDRRPDDRRRLRRATSRAARAPDGRVALRLRVTRRARGKRQEARRQEEGRQQAAGCTVRFLSKLGRGRKLRVY